MEEHNRISRRSRPRPYDLRRKVLLKNFLREQMTHIPETQIESVSQSNNNNFAQESSVSIHEDLPNLNNEDASSLHIATPDIQNSSSSCDNIESNCTLTTSKVDVLDNINDSVVNVNLPSDSVRESSMFKFAGLIKFTKESKKTLKGIVKAKEVRKYAQKSPIKLRSFKSGVERVFYGRKRQSESSSQSQTPRNSPRSLFSLFKYRKEQRQLKEIVGIKRSTCIDLKNSGVSAKYSTINQSVQTDDSWAKKELIKVQQSNRRLKEENRLLSESLSFFMSNASMDPQVRHSNFPLQSSNKNINSTVYPDYYSPSSNSGSASRNPRSRISRSKSVQGYSERRNLSRNNYRTRSMNNPSGQNNLFTDSKQSVSTYGTQSQEFNIPRVRRKNVLINLPVSSSVRAIQRRASMPERILSENDRTISRRSDSVRDTRSRKPFYSLPSEAFY